MPFQMLNQLHFPASVRVCQTSRKASSLNGYDCKLLSMEGHYTYSILPLHSNPILLFFKIYLFLAALGLRCCARAFSSCDKRGLFFLAVRGLLIAVASLVAEHGL